MRIRLSFTRELTLATLSGLATYCETLESQLQSAKDADKGRIEEFISKLELDDHQAFAEWQIAVDEHEMTFSMLSPNFFRYSFVTLASLIAEVALRDLCFATKNVRKLPERRPRREILREYKSYLVKVAGINSLRWDALEELNVVRNCIVHAAGNVSGFSKEPFLRQLAGNRPGLLISEVGQEPHSGLLPLYLQKDMLVLEPAYRRQILLNMQSFFEALCDAIPLPRMTIEERSGYNTTVNCTNLVQGASEY